MGDRALLERLQVNMVHHNPSVGRSAADGVYAIMQWASLGGDFMRCRLDSSGGSQVRSAASRTHTQLLRSLVGGGLRSRRPADEGPLVVEMVDAPGPHLALRGRLR